MSRTVTRIVLAFALALSLATSGAIAVNTSPEPRTVLANGCCSK